MSYFVPIGDIKDRITNIYPKYLNGKLWPYHLLFFISFFLYDPAYITWLSKKFVLEIEVSYFKIICILVRQVISLKKKWWCHCQNLLFNFMVSYLYSFNPCIIINEIGKYLTHSNIEQYESRHSYRTFHIRVKGSDSRAFF